MLRKRIVSDDTLKRLIAAADRVAACDKVGKRAYPNFQTSVLLDALNKLEKKDVDEVLIFELAEPELRKARYDEWVRRSKERSDLSHLDVEVQIQKMTGAYYFHLINCIKRHLKKEEGLQAHDA